MLVASSEATDPMEVLGIAAMEYGAGQLGCGLSSVGGRRIGTCKIVKL